MILHPPNVQSNPSSDLAKFIGALFDSNDLVTVGPVETWTEPEEGKPQRLKQPRVVYRHEREYEATSRNDSDANLLSQEALSAPVSGAYTPLTDSDLTRVVAAWPGLPEQVRGAILTLFTLSTSSEMPQPSMWGRTVRTTIRLRPIRGSRATDSLTSEVGK